MDEAKSRELLERAEMELEVLKSMFDEVDYEGGVYNILGTLVEALKADPNNVAASVMRVRLIGDELGAFAEAFEEADALAKREPGDPALAVLRERMRLRAKEHWPATPDE